jgi:hypothetical protein
MANSVLFYYDCSLYKALEVPDSSISSSNAPQAVYPEFTWYQWLFDSCPHNFWLEASNQRKYLDWIAETLQISSWHQVSNRDILPYKGERLLNLYNNSITQAVLTLYPDQRLHGSIFSVSEEQWTQQHTRYMSSEIFIDSSQYASLSPF